MQVSHDVPQGTMSVISFGMNGSWTSPYVPQLLSDTSKIPMNSDEAAWCAIAHLCGCPFGALAAAYLTDRIGRKYTLLSMAPMVFFSQIGIGYVTNVWHLFVLKMIIGVADGGCFTVVPMYIGEISSPDIRGFLSSLVCLFYILGVLLMNALGFYCSILTSSIISASIPAAHFLGFVFMPESPYYYIKVKKYYQAERSLMILRGESNVAKEVEVLKQAVRMQEEMVERPKFTDLFTVPSNRKAAFIFVILCTANKASAKAPLMSYTRYIFEETGSSISPAFSTILYCLVELLVVMFTTYFIIDRFGKRFLAIISSVGCSVTLFIMGLYFYLKDYHSDVIQQLNWLPLTNLIVNNVLFSIGISFTHMCYLSELFPTNVKANALCFAEILAVAQSAVTTKGFQMLNDRCGTLSISFFSAAVIGCIVLVFIVKYVPETKGKTLEEIQLFLMEKEDIKLGSGESLRQLGE
nr:facilitated trehalose transporter Tret1-like [Leptinotarsa decemlineata]